MGRLFRAARVAQTVQKNLAIARTPRLRDTAPPWLRVVETIPPAEILVRTVPAQHHAPDAHMRKPRRTYRPQRIVYEEDELRQTFFRDHPWELARPRVVVELDGKDAQMYDWSRGLVQPGMPLCGECVVQRQLWLMQNGMPKDEAYDQARREFYALRHLEDVERRVAVEEARMVGAYFGKSTLQFGMELEDKTYERWKVWAASETAKIEAERSQAYVSFGDETDEAGEAKETEGQAV